MKRVILLTTVLALLLFLWRNRRQLDDFTHRLAWALGAFILLGFSVRVYQWLNAGF